MDLIELLAQELGQTVRFVENVVRLLDEGNTIPFVARYRKEQHGGMDDTTHAYAGRAPHLFAQSGQAAPGSEERH